MNPLRSIRGKLLVVMLSTSFCSLLVAGGLILYHDVSTFRTTRINDLTTQIELLAYSAVPALKFENRLEAQHILDLLKIRPTVRAAAIYNARGGFFAGYIRDGLSHAFPTLPGEEGVIIDNDRLTVFKRIIDDGEILGTAYLQSDYQLYDRVMEFVGILMLVSVGAMLVAGAISIWLQSMITRPMLSIVSVARNVVANKDYSRRARKLSGDEVGVLVEAFNEMLDEIVARTRALEQTNRNLETQVNETTHVREEILLLNEQLERKVAERTRQLELTNQELESFCYSVSHDLRGPLRAISGFSQALVEELPPGMPEECRRYLDRILAGTKRMGQLIEDLLNLSRVSRGELIRQDVDFSAMTREVIRDLVYGAPDYKVDVSVWDGIRVDADPKLLRIVLENLLGNAWKFTTKTAEPRVEVGRMIDGNREVLYVRDNGAGFDMAYADKLFGAFQRLHGINEFPGTGIGLATVQRVIHRHGGKIWFHSVPGKGAVFYFTLKHGEPVA